MNTIATKDGTRIYYKDWGGGQPVVFSHGWPLSADAWEYQVVLIGASAMLSCQIVKGAMLKVYPSLPHGLCSTNNDQINADLLAFFQT